MRKPARFTKLWIESLKHPSAGTRTDHQESGRPGFQLRVGGGEKGQKVFVFRYQREHHRRVLTLGTFPESTLEEAHERYEAARKHLREGRDPASAIEEQRQAEGRARAAEAGAASVGRLVDEWYTRYALKERKRPEAAKVLLDANLPDWFCVARAKDVTRRQVIEVTDGIADRSPSVANDVASLLKQVFAFGVERDLITASPIVGMKPPGGTEKPRDRVLSDEEIKVFWHKLPLCITRTVGHGKGKKHKVHGMSERVQLALRFILLTAQRRGETARAKWADIDFAAKTWTIPAEDAKTGQAHIVPLSPAALAILDRLQQLQADEKSAFVFPSHHRIEKGDVPMTERAISHAVREHEDVFDIPHWTPHDLRRTARTEMARLGVVDTVAELILNHRLQGMVAVYNKYQYLDEKRAALDLWASHVEKLVAKP
jgi:integrase